MKSRSFQSCFALPTLVLLCSLTAFAADRVEIPLDGRQHHYEIRLEGTRYKTTKGFEMVKSTCTREVPVMKTVCEVRDVRNCETIPGDPICNITPTAEDCGDREVCTTTEEHFNCVEVPGTQTRTETYACTEKRPVPKTEKVEELTADVTIRVSGDTGLLTGNDSFEVSITNGADVGPSVGIELRQLQRTHFLHLETVEYVKTSPGEKRSHFRAVYEISVVPTDVSPHP